MSFGLLKHFKDLKKNDNEVKAPVHVQHVILGHDLGAVLKLIEIKRTHPEESVKLISLRPLNRQALIENYEYGPTVIRAQEDVEGIYKRFYNASIFPQNKTVSFYKDGKFHDFGGRAKSMDLQVGEGYFTSPGYKLALASLFTPQEWENLDQILSAHQEIRIFESIEKTTPTDLVEKAEWTMTFKDFSRVTCENLYVNISPKKFHQILANKELHTKELIDLCTGVQIQSAIAVSWVLDKEFFSEERTLFIPQSMTHEWGHFIVEFESYNYAQKTQMCHVLFLIQEEEPQTEDMGSKIKLMKRVLDRVFPDIEQHILKEYIRFDEEMFITGFKQDTLEQVNFDYPNLKFIEKSLTRTLLSH